MSTFQLIKSIQAKQVFGLLRFFIKHPVFTLVTIKATIDTYKIAQREFPNIHGKLNKANAFRHAIWNIIIAKYCSKFSSDLEKPISWAKKFTDWHEDLFVNEPLPRFMDEYNNEFGRHYFKQHSDSSIDEIITQLKKDLENAIEITSIDVQFDNKKMVYIED